MVKIVSKKEGAELTSIKFDGEEKLHDGLKDWNRHSPVLFPIVGKLKNGETIIENKICKMGQHGFARDSVFEQIGEHSYILKYNQETLEKFPYKFELYISYETTDDSIIVKYQEKNVDDKKIRFGLGAHPAFRCQYQNCELEFEKVEEQVIVYQLENGLVKLEEEEIPNLFQKNVMKLDENTFNNDAIILKNLSSNKVILKEKNKKILEFNFTDFPFLGIWTKPGANFLCIEPWLNTADKVDSDGRFENKANLIILNKEEIFSCQYEVRFF